MPQTVQHPTDKNPDDTRVTLPKQVVAQIISNILAESVDHATEKLVASAVDSTVGTLLTGEHPGDTITLPFEVAFFLRVGSHLIEDYAPDNHPGVIAEKELAQALIDCDETRFNELHVAFHS